MLCVGYSRCVFAVAEVGSWNAEDVVQGVFQVSSVSGHVQGFITRIHPISVLRLDSAGDHSICERGYH